MTDDPDSILLGSLIMLACFLIAEMLKFMSLPGHVMLQIGEFTREHEDNHYKVVRMKELIGMKSFISPTKNK